MGRFLQRDEWPGQPEDPSSLVNKYSYCGNNPVNWLDPFGLDKQKKEKPWWEKLEEGYYYGTGFGQEAAEWYAQRWIETGKWYYAFGGGVSSLWTPETYQQTAWTLLTAWQLAGWAAETGPTVTWRGGEIVIKSGEKTAVRINPFGNPKETGPGRLPHYHRRPFNRPAGPGEGIGKHRPWEGW